LEIGEDRGWQRQHLVRRLVHLIYLHRSLAYPSTALLISTAMKQTPITQRISSLISWVLVADLGLVLLSLGWFLVAVLGRSMNLDLGLDLWYSLWNPLILPALSVLMAGAIASGIVGWVGRRFNTDPS